MNIWYLHHYAGGPGLGPFDRAFELGKAWRAAGHDQTVFFAHYHHLLQRDTVVEPMFEIEGVRYRAVEARRYQGNGVGRILNMWDFAAQFSAATRGLGKPDVVIASSPHPFTIYPAYWAARKASAKLVFEVRDIWPLSITQILGISKLHPFVLLCRAAESFALNQADVIASVLPRFDKYLSDQNVAHKSFVWVPNGLSITGKTAPNDLNAPTARDAAEKAKKWRERNIPIIIYTGSIGKPNAIEFLIEALTYGAKKRGRETVGAIIVGDGDKSVELKALAENSGLSTVHFAGRVPKTDAIELLRLADIAYAGLRDIGSVFQYGVSPNKIADYAQAGVPVILPIDSCGDPVSESGGGVTRAVTNGVDVWHMIEELLAIGPNGRRRLGEALQRYMRGEYDYRKIADRYIAALR